MNTNFRKPSYAVLPLIASFAVALLAQASPQTQVPVAAGSEASGGYAEAPLSADALRILMHGGVVAGEAVRRPD